MKSLSIVCSLVLLFGCSSQPELLDIELWGQWLDSTEQYYVQFRPETRDTAWICLPNDTAHWHLWKIRGEAVQIGPYVTWWEADSPFGKLWLGELELRQSRGIRIRMEGLPTP